jgi:hypothetical protein
MSPLLRDRLLKSSLQRGRLLKDRGAPLKKTMPAKAAVRAAADAREKTDD